MSRAIEAQMGGHGETVAELEPEEEMRHDASFPGNEQTVSKLDRAGYLV